MTCAASRIASVAITWLLRGDARQLVGGIEPLDLAVFSPPYPNSFDYTDVYNVELWTLGYLDSPAKNTALRKQTLRSHVQIYRDMSSNGVRSPLLLRTMQELEAASAKLWNPHIPAMIGAYTADMAVVLKGSRTSYAPRDASTWSWATAAMPI